MEFFFISLALLAGLGLGFIIGKLTGSRAGIEAQTENRSLRERLAKLEAEQGALTQKFQEEFSRIANAVLKDGLQTVTTTAQTNLATLLNPLQSKLGEFQNRLEQSVVAQGRDSAALKEQIRSLTDLNKTVGDEARRLALALKGEAKSRGNWGEMVLERLLDVAGLIKGTHFDTQVSLKSEGGERRPDVIVRLPDGKDLIIDSKVSLVQYEKLFGEATEEARMALRKEHLGSLKKHVDDLGKKDYSGLQGVNSIDLVFMFVPIEGAFLEALNEDAKLYDYAFQKNVVILTPGTLLVTLKLVAQMWQQDNQNKNALKIAEEGGKLYDKFVGFVDDMQALGRQMETARGTYAEAMGKLHSGQGNLVTRSENLRVLGVKAKKRLQIDAE